MLKKEQTILKEYMSGLKTSYTRMIADSGKAGGTASSIANWLLQFPQHKPTNDAGWRDLSYEVMVFLRGYGLSRKKTEAGTVHYETWEPTSPGSLPRLLPNQTEIRGLQEIVRQALDSLLSAGIARFPILAGQLEVRRNGNSPSYVVDLPFYRFCYQAAQLIAEFSDRIKACKTQGCRVIFVSRKNQEHHNESCRSLAWKRDRRGTLPERFGKRGRPRKQSQKVTQ
jgi:hypothetical protein